MGIEYQSDVSHSTTDFLSPVYRTVTIQQHGSIWCCWVGLHPGPKARKRTSMQFQYTERPCWSSIRWYCCSLSTLTDTDTLTHYVTFMQKLVSVPVLHGPFEDEITLSLHNSAMSDCILIHCHLAKNCPKIPFSGTSFSGRPTPSIYYLP